MKTDSPAARTSQTACRWHIGHDFHRVQASLLSQQPLQDNDEVPQCSWNDNAMEAKVRALYGQGVDATEIARKLKIGRSTLYKVLELG